MNKIHSEIKELAESLDSNQELSNLCQDLEAVLQRLKNKEYQETDFLQRNVFDIPRRTHEFFTYFLGYYQQAMEWVQLLKPLPWKEIQNVIDIGPGWAPKIEWALGHLNFEGTLYLLDKNNEWADQLKKFLKILRFNYPINFLKEDFFFVNAPVADVVVANHLIDDLLLDQYCLEYGYTLEQVYASEKLICELTSFIITTCPRHEFCEQVVKRLDQMIRKGGFIAIVHYPSLTEKALNLNSWILFIDQLFQEIYHLLLERSYREVHSSFSAISALPKQYFLLIKENFK